MQLTNAPFVLSEVAAALYKLVETGESRTLFLSQFPMTDEDAAFLRHFLGQGETSVEITGVSHTRFRETRYSGVWWGEYFSAPDTVSLHTIEIAEVPELVLAANEDMTDGLKLLMERLPEIICTKSE